MRYRPTMVRASTIRRMGEVRKRLRRVEETPTIELMAQETGLSTGQFIRVFAGLFGQTPHQCRIDARLNQARLLLAAGELPVTAVCLEVGFSSLGSFSHLFSRRVGMSPMAYRRHVRCLVPVPELRRAFVAPACMTLMQTAFARLPAEVPCVRSPD